MSHPLTCPNCKTWLSNLGFIRSTDPQPKCEKCGYTPGSGGLVGSAWPEIPLICGECGETLDRKTYTGVCPNTSCKSHENKANVPPKAAPKSEGEEIPRRSSRDASGDSAEYLRKIAQGWSVLFNADVTPREVEIALFWLKFCERYDFELKDRNKVRETTA